MKVGLIYAYRDPRTYRWVYVGSVQNQNTLDRRHRRHLCERKGLLPLWLYLFSPGQEPRPQIMQHVGWDNVATLLEKEDQWMKRLGTRASEGGLNQVQAVGPDHAAMGRIGGHIAGPLNRGRVHSEATRQKMSDARRGKTHSETTCQKIATANRGHICNEVTRQKIAAANRGKTASEATRQKMRGKVPWNKGKMCGEATRQKLRGRVCSEVTRQKIGTANRGRVRSEATCQKISVASRGKNRGRVHSDAARQNMSAAHRGQVPWNKGLRLSSIAPGCWVDAVDAYAA